MHIPDPLNTNISMTLRVEMVIVPRICDKASLFGLSAKDYHNRPRATSHARQSLAFFVRPDPTDASGRSRADVGGIFSDMEDDDLFSMCWVRHYSMKVVRGCVVTTLVVVLVQGESIIIRDYPARPIQVFEIYELLRPGHTV